MKTFCQQTLHLAFGAGVERVKRMRKDPVSKMDQACGANWIGFIELLPMLAASDRLVTHC